MASSNLQSLVRDLLQPLKDNPDALLIKILGQTNFYKLNGLLKSPLAKVFIPPSFDPAALIAGAVDKFEDLAPDFWDELETVLAGVISGDEEQTAKARKLLGGVVVDEDKNFTQ